MALTVNVRVVSDAPVEGDVIRIHSTLGIARHAQFAVIETVPFPPSEPICVDVAPIETLHPGVA